MRYNLISDSGADKFFDIILPDKKLDKVFIKNNSLTTPYISSLHSRIHDFEFNIFIDVLDKIQYLDQKRIDRSIWIAPIDESFTKLNITKFFQDTHNCGLITDVRICHSEGKPGKGETSYAFIEYQSEVSVVRSLRIAWKKPEINSQQFRIFRAGTALNVNTLPKSSKVPAKRNIGKGGRGGRGGRGSTRGKRSTRGRGGALNRINRRKRVREDSSSPVNRRRFERNANKRIKF